MEDAMDVGKVVLTDEKKAVCSVVQLVAWMDVSLVDL